MIQVTAVKTKCDVRDCKNDADFYFVTKGRGGKCFVCKQCLDKLCGAVLAQRTPKSPKNTIKKQIEKRQEDMLYGEK